MRTILLLITFMLILISTKAQEYKFLKPNLVDSCTIIKHIIEEKVEQEYLVYLDKRTSTKEKASLMDCSYIESLLKDTESKYKKLLNGTTPDLINMQLPRYWYQPVQYKNELVIYKSNEVNEAFILSDSLFALHEMDGLYLTVFKQTSFANDKYYIKAIKEDYYMKDKNIDITIQAINKKKGLYLWEYKTKTKKWYKVMIAANKLAYYPIINILSYDAMIDIHIDTEPIDIDAIIKLNE